MYGLEPYAPNLRLERYPVRYGGCTSRPAPECQVGWKDRAAARASLERILSWDLRTVMMARGEPIMERARETLEKAWARVLGR